MFGFKKVYPNTSEDKVFCILDAYFQEEDDQSTVNEALTSS